MSDITVRWPVVAGEGEQREDVFENARLELLSANGMFVGYLVKGLNYQHTIPFARIEMLSEVFEHDPRDDDKPDTGPRRLTVVPK